MDIIKVEHESDIDTQPMPSPSESQAATVKVEDPLEPFTFVAVKQEVVSIWWFYIDTIVKNRNCEYFSIMDRKLHKIFIREPHEKVLLGNMKHIY
jgi:hypothetical protein